MTEQVGWLRLKAAIGDLWPEATAVELGQGELRADGYSLEVLKVLGPGSSEKTLEDILLADH